MHPILLFIIIIYNKIILKTIVENEYLVQFKIINKNV